MSTQMLEAVRKSVVVETSAERAWETFTERLSTWWPLERYSIGKGEANVVVEGRAGGRVYERLPGQDAVWADVVVWEPPERLVLSWFPGRDAAVATEVDIRFTPEGDATRVDLEHRGWERLGDVAGEARQSSASGWDAVLGRYADAASS